MSDNGETPAPPQRDPAARPRRRWAASPRSGRAASPRRGHAPPPVENAVRLMMVRAALTLISIIVTLATTSQLRSRIAKANPTLSKDSIDNSYTVALVASLVFAVVVLVLYVLLGYQVRHGRQWARVTTWVFAGLGVLGALFSLASTVTPAARVFSLVVGVIDVAIIVLLAQAASNSYFKPQPRY